jgi:aspartyl-tRNA(Asn)/glutamyl-tRNA(Gln) amidotransferase subunit A
MTKLTHLTIAQAREMLLNKSITALDLVQAHIDAIDAHNAPLNAYVHRTNKAALQAAKQSDARIASGTARALEGIPIGVKDVFCTKNVPTQAASHILDGFKPPYESSVTQNLIDAGAIMLGKLNMDEFAMGSDNSNSHYGACISPWRSTDKPDQKRVPGGSSGGSASAVSARLAMMAMGTDTGGSIRQPAAYTGIVGMKPSYGRCSRYGIIAYASSLDQAGSFTRSVEDMALCMGVICGHDAKDSTSANLPVPDFAAALNSDIKGKKIGIPKEYRVDGMDKAIAAEWQKGEDLLKQAGAEIVPISLPHTAAALATYYIIAPAEASSNLARYDGVRYGLRVCEQGDGLDEMYLKTRAKGFGDEVKRRILIGTYVLSAGYYEAYYKKAQSVRQLIVQDFQTAFETVDVILTPTAPTPAFAVGANKDEPVAMYLNDVFTVPTSLAGLPAISIPSGLSENGLPLGLQLIGKQFDEQGVLDVAKALETALAFNHKPAEIAA